VVNIYINSVGILW